MKPIIIAALIALTVTPVAVAGESTTSTSLWSGPTEPTASRATCTVKIKEASRATFHK